MIVLPLTKEREGSVDDSPALSLTLSFSLTVVRGSFLGEEVPQVMQSLLIRLLPTLQRPRSINFYAFPLASYLLRFLFPSSPLAFPLSPSRSLSLSFPLSPQPSGKLNPLPSVPIRLPPPPRFHLLLSLCHPALLFTLCFPHVLAPSLPLPIPSPFSFLSICLSPSAHPQATLCRTLKPRFHGRAKPLSRSLRHGIVAIDSDLETCFSSDISWPPSVTTAAG